MLHYVYALVDPDMLDIRYIGYTSVTPEKRLLGHLNGALKNETASSKNLWLYAMLDQGKRPNLVVLQSSADQQSILLAERWWIAHGQMIGWNLLNEAHVSRHGRERKKIIPHLRTRRTITRRGYIETGGMFPLQEKRPLTTEEAGECRILSAKGISKSALCFNVYGSKSGRYMAWINEALEEAGG